MHNPREINFVMDVLFTSRGYRYIIIHRIIISIANHIDLQPRQLLLFAHIYLKKLNNNCYRQSITTSLNKINKEYTLIMSVLVCSILLCELQIKNII